MPRRSYARSRYPRTRQGLHLAGVERLLFILGATLYVVGLLGGFGLLPMASLTAIILLAIGGGLELVVMVMLIL